eukprot:6775149-Prymnesium_polylepis.1
MPCSATWCGVVAAVSAAPLEMAEACGLGAVASDTRCQYASTSAGGASADRPHSIELVESSTCEFGSRTGDPPALHRAPSTCKQQTGTASEATRSTKTIDSPPIELCEMVSPKVIVISRRAHTCRQAPAPPREARRERFFPAMVEATSIP